MCNNNIYSRIIITKIITKIAFEAISSPVPQASTQLLLLLLLQQS